MINKFSFCALVVCYFVTLSSASAQSIVFDGYSQTVNGSIGGAYTADQSSLRSEWQISCTSPSSSSTTFFFDMTWERANDGMILTTTTMSEVVAAGNVVVVYPWTTWVSDDPSWGAEYYVSIEVSPTNDVDYTGYFWPDF